MIGKPSWLRNPGGLRSTAAAKTGQVWGGGRGWSRRSRLAGVSRRLDQAGLPVRQPEYRRAVKPLPVMAAVSGNRPRRFKAASYASGG